MLKIKLVVVCLLLTTLCSACSETTSCQTADVDVYMQELNLLLDEFDDIVVVANATPRSDLSSLIKDMQDIKRNTDKLVFPECAGYLQDYAIVRIETEIESFVSFLSEEENEVFWNYADVANQAHDLLIKEIDAFKENPRESSANANPNLGEPTPFVIPEGWVNFSLVENNGEDYIISVPETWNTFNLGGEPALLLQNQNDSMRIIVTKGDDLFRTELHTDAGRLFRLRTDVATDYPYDYKMTSAKSSLFGENKIIEINLAKESVRLGEHTNFLSWGYIETPDEEWIVLLCASTEETDREWEDTLKLIQASIRKPN